MVMRFLRRTKNVVVFDSGIGGLNLLRECCLRAPRVHYYYVSDNDNVPYGNRPTEEILRLTLRALDGIERLDPAALVVACNTVTARCIDELRRLFSFPVVGIQPAVKQAAEVGGRCLVLATKSTVGSPAFRALITKYAPSGAEIYGCGELANYIEKNIFSLPERLPDRLLPDVCADSVVLGCTHYSFVLRQIEAKYNCPVFDGVAGTADHYAKIVGIADHVTPRAGIFDHSANSNVKITFLRGNRQLNEQIAKYLFGI